MSSCPSGFPRQWVISHVRLSPSDEAVYPGFGLMNSDTWEETVKQLIGEMQESQLEAENPCGWVGLILN